MKGAVMKARKRSAFTLKDLIVVLIITPLVLTAMIGCYRRYHGDRANRVSCSSNLSMIYKAIAIYANDNRGDWPRTLYEPGPDPLVPSLTNQGFDDKNPFDPNNAGATSQVPVNNVPAAIFWILRSEQLTSKCFVCPNGNAVPDD